MTPIKIKPGYHGLIGLDINMLISIVLLFYIPRNELLRKFISVSNYSSSSRGIRMNKDNLTLIKHTTSQQYKMFVTERAHII